MITFRQGNLLAAPVEALVNPVNTVGVMGKGLALLCKQAFPASFRAYAGACRRREVRVGRMFVTETGAVSGPRWLIHFPTKQHWRDPSQLGWIVEGLTDLRRVIAEKKIASIAVPALGCGNGGLDWGDVRPLLVRALGDLEGVAVLVYEPERAGAHGTRQEAGGGRLTPAGALVAEMVRRYWVVGSECTLLEVEKLCWLLERSASVLGIGSPLGLAYRAGLYGPYADGLADLLDGLGGGGYLERGTQLGSESLWFAEGKRGELARFLEREENRDLVGILDRTEEGIDGFQSPFGLELLATVDWLVAREGYAPTVEGIQAGMAAWPGGDGGGGLAAQRKLRVFDERCLRLGLERMLFWWWAGGLGVREVRA